MTKKTYTIDTDEWQVVPKRMTFGMIAPTPFGDAGAQRVWAAILAAAPEPPAQPRRPYGTDTLSEYGVIPECDGPEPPAQQPMGAADLVARLRTMSATGWHPIGDEAANEIEQARRTSQFHKDNHLAAEAEIERLRLAQQPMTHKQAYAIAEEFWDEYGIPRQQTLRVIRDTELHHGIGKGESNAD